MSLTLKQRKARIDAIVNEIERLQTGLSSDLTGPQDRGELTEAIEWIERRMGATAYPRPWPPQKETP